MRVTPLPMNNNDELPVAMKEEKSATRKQKKRSSLVSFFSGTKSEESERPKSSSFLDRSNCRRVRDAPTKPMEEGLEFTVCNEYSRTVALPSRKSLALFAKGGDENTSEKGASQGLDLHDTWYYSSNHVLINQERVKRGIAPLMRNKDLDEKARTIAQKCADKCKIKKKIPKGYTGHAIRGLSIRDIHHHTMVDEDCAERKTLLSSRYFEFGVGVVKGNDGLLYLCQLFDKSRLDN